MKQAPVYVYLPDGEVVGTAQIVTENRKAILTIDIPLDPGVSEALAEQLVGISFMYLSRDAAEVSHSLTVDEKNPAGDISAKQNQGDSDGVI